MPPVGFEHTIPTSSRPQTYALDLAATGIDTYNCVASHDFMVVNNNCVGVWNEVLVAWFKVLSRSVCGGNVHWRYSVFRRRFELDPSPAGLRQKQFLLKQILSILMSV
jgi:hypothetical protein